MHKKGDRLLSPTGGRLLPSDRAPAVGQMHTWAAAGLPAVLAVKPLLGAQHGNASPLLLLGEEGRACREHSAE